MTSQVLISWVAVNNDPFESPKAQCQSGRSEGAPARGPTLTLLFDENSPHKGRIGDVVLLHREAAPASKEQQAVVNTQREIARLGRNIRFHDVPWRGGEDPTDHGAIFKFLRRELPKLRRRFAGRELVIHISPGTPSMQTIWVLMGETGLIERPFKLVKSFRREDRHGRPPVVPVGLDIDTFYKAYMSARPRRVASEEQRVLWDPARFRTARMKQVFAEARRFAPLNVPVLLLGERGTGKTTLASWIRLHSPFRREDQDAGWPAVACGQYSPETMRAELFGYRKGAFTGATQDRNGLIHAADGDTLFLDEVGDVSRDLQRLLIKAVEEKEYVRLGDIKPQRSDFRLLTATNIDAGELRDRLDPDFLDRISLLQLRLPPLREIREELPWLWQETYREAASRSGIAESVAQLNADCEARIVKALTGHPLPGNMRDLLKVAYRLLAALGDPHEPLAEPDAVHYALAGLEDRSTGASGVAANVARAFADGRDLDAAFDGCGRPFPAKTVEADLRSFMGAELRRIAKERDLSEDDVADVGRKTLYNWASRK